MIRGARGFDSPHLHSPQAGLYGHVVLRQVPVVFELDVAWYAVGSDCR